MGEQKEADLFGQVDLTDGKDMTELLDLDCLDIHAGNNAPWAKQAPAPPTDSFPHTPEANAQSAPLPPSTGTLGNLDPINSVANQDVDLDLSEFDIESGQGRLSSSGGYKQVNGNQEMPNPFGNAWFWNIEYYMPFFDLTTDDVMRRLRMVTDVNGPPAFFDDLGHRPADMYGAVWSSVTFCLAFGVADSFWSWWNHSPIMWDAFGAVEEWEMELYRLWNPIYIVFLLVVCLPGVLYALIRREGGQMQLLPMISLQGYSLAPFVPAVGICALPIWILRWAGLIAALYASGKFTFKNLERLVKSSLTGQNLQLAGAGTAFCYVVSAWLFYSSFG